MSTSTSTSGNGDAPGPTPSKLGRLFERIHAAHAAERAIASTAIGRRVKAQQRRKEQGSEQQQ